MKRLLLAMAIVGVVAFGPSVAQAAPVGPPAPPVPSLACTQALFNDGLCVQSPVTTPAKACDAASMAAGNCVVDIVGEPGAPAPGFLDAIKAGLSAEGNTLVSGILDTKCDQAPTPAVPGTGITGELDPKPSGGNTTLYDKTAYGPGWSTFNTGCLPNPAASIDTGIGNLFYGGAQDVVALSNGVSKAVAPPTFLNVFNKLETNISRALYQNFYVIFLPLSLIVLGLALVWKSRRQNMPEAVKMAGWALGVMALAALVFANPLKIGQAASNAETSSVQMVSGAVGGNTNDPSAVSSLEVNSLLYPNWLKGEIGTSTGPIAERWGPKLWESQTLTWAEAASPDRANIVKAKQKEFATVAAAIGDEDPVALDHLKGKAGGRWLVGFEAFLGAACTSVFRIVAALMVVASLGLIALLVLLFPLLAPVGLHDRLSPVVKVPLSAGFAAVVNTILFSGFGAVNVLLISALFDPSSALPAWLAIITSLVIAVFLFFLTKPLRHLTSLAGGLAFTKSVNQTGKQAKKHGAHFVKKGVEMGVGIATGEGAVFEGIKLLTGKRGEKPARRESIAGKPKVGPQPQPGTPPSPSAPPGQPADPKPKPGPILTPPTVAKPQPAPVEEPVDPLGDFEPYQPVSVPASPKPMPEEVAS